MRIGIIGGGAAGIYSALLIKQDHPNYEVHIFEKEKKLGRKLCATGNGRCNLLNQNLVPEKYNHPSLMKGVIEAYPFDYLCSVVKSFGVPLRNENGYIYPESYSAVAYTDFLIDLLHQFKVFVHLGETVEEYQQKGGQFAIITLSCTDFGVFDKLVFTIGGASTPNLGSDGKTFPVFAKHGYRIVSLRPGLCPIKVKHPEQVKPLAGIRRPALVRALVGSKKAFEEEGEVLFKEDGLSGIVIFNLESALMRIGFLPLSEIHIDLFPDKEVTDLEEELRAFWKLNPNHFLDAYFPLPLVDYIYKINNLNNSQIKTSDFPSLASSLKDLVFFPSAAYPFSSSQVTLGGISFDDIGAKLESKLEPGVFFAGEILDLDGDCGGYNLTWALMSSLIVDEAI